MQKKCPDVTFQVEFIEKRFNFDGDDSQEKIIRNVFYPYSNFIPTEMFKKNSAFILFVFLLNSCSKEYATVGKEQLFHYSYTNDEINLIGLINKYRDSIGLQKLAINDHISYVSFQHNKDMIRTNLVSHNGFVDRSESLMKLLEATSVGENIAYNYDTNKKAFNAWLKSPEHKKNIEGNFSQFGLSIVKDTLSNKKYYTNIFIKTTK